MRYPPTSLASSAASDVYKRQVTEAIGSHPLITLVREEIARVPPVLDGPIVIATGPLTSESLSADIAAMVGSDHLYFYDAISPIVLAETIDHGKVFRASRWGRSLRASLDKPVLSETLIPRQAQDERRVEGLRTSGGLTSGLL